MFSVSLDEFLDEESDYVSCKNIIWFDYVGENDKAKKIFESFKNYIKTAKGGSELLNKSVPNGRKEICALIKYLAGVISKEDENFDELKFFGMYANEKPGETGGNRFNIPREKSRPALDYIGKYFSNQGVDDFWENTLVNGIEETDETNSSGKKKRFGYNHYFEKFYTGKTSILHGESSEKGRNEGEMKISITSLNTILEGVAGCGKTHYQKSLFESDREDKDPSFKPERSETVVFHPSTSYEDFVSGLRPQKNGSFIGKPGIFVELCNRATADHENNYLLFIDEINRANTAKVFGDLLMVIEESKRTPVNELEEYGRAVLTRREAKELGYTNVRLQTAIDDLPKGANPPKPEYEGDLEYLAVPDNLYIVGTMNSTDRSVGTIDLALRRRFTWQTMEPLTAVELRGKVEPKDQEDLKNLEELLKRFDSANNKLRDKVGPDAMLGHSYFFQKNKSAQQIAHDLFKQLAEVAYIFHLEDLMAEKPFDQPILGLRLKNVGEGLGQKVIVEQVSAKSREGTNGESKIEENASEESSNSSEES